MFNNYNPYYGNNMYQRPSQPSAFLKGRMVTGIDEVRASQVDLDGSVTYFASPAEGKIYAKGIDMQGLPYIQVYELQKAPAVPQDMETRLIALENKIREVENYVQHPTDNANVIEQR